MGFVMSLSYLIDMTHLAAESEHGSPVLGFDADAWDSSLTSHLLFQAQDTCFWLLSSCPEVCAGQSALVPGTACVHVLEQSLQA